MKRGRPPRSAVRQNIVDILHFLKCSSGYDIYKVYREIFPPVTLRNIYYHLKKGVALGEFEVESIKKVTGSYSWGTQTEKVFYTLGKHARPKADERIKHSLESKKIAA